MEEIFKTTTKILDDLKIPRYRYAFEEFIDDAYCVVFENKTWNLYYYERGKKDLQFANENIAVVCDELIKRLS